MSTTMSESNCPLCGGPNDCGIAQGKSICWCFNTAIPEDLLARIPDEQRNQSCICEACATRQSGAIAAADPSDRSHS